MNRYITYEIKKPDHWEFDFDEDEVLGYEEELQAEINRE